jgi:spore coat polysaccharide biosynthesis predicted glycosyltransferase SpsG
MGHVMRCLSIAEAAYEGKNIKPVFITADNEGGKLISEKGFKNVVLGTDYKDMESEVTILSKILKKDDIILVDSYKVTVEYYIELGKLCKTACLEDMGEPYPVDILINYNIYGTKLRANYVYNHDENNHDKNNHDDKIFPKKVFLGLEYMPLRSAFRSNLEYDIKDKVADVMVTTGGSDPLYAAGSILEKIVEIKGITIHMVSGPFNKNADRLKLEYGNRDNVVIYENLKDMKALMKKCDVVITATGSTIYELSALGVPMICFYFAENQRQGAEEIENLTDIVNAGCFATDANGVSNKTYNTLLRCIDDYEYRKTIHEQEKNLVDGNGALRIVEGLINC